MNIDDLALTLEPGIGPKTIAQLLDAFTTASAVYEAPPAEIMRRADVREPLAVQISRRESHREAEKEMKRIAREEIAAIASTDPEYPALMREMNDHPHVLYVRGNVGALSMKCVSMVGTRRISQYGQVMCDRLVRELAERVPGLSIVSGLAFGIDAHCHRAALRYGVPTVAVVANALPGITPPTQAGFAQDIIAHGGAVVTEYSALAKNRGNLYIPRNRLIAGMSAGTVVVEATTDSGALSTADFALDYYRALMAVPGRATDEIAFGTNNLIKNQKAQMVCSGEDILRTLMWDVNDPEVGEKPPKRVVEISDAARELLSGIGDGTPVSTDSLSASTGLTYPELAPLLLELEFANVLRRMPGGVYEKIS